MPRSTCGHCNCGGYQSFRKPQLRSRSLVVAHRNATRGPGGFPMFRKLAVVCLGAALAVSAAAQERSQTALTIYNHDFAVVRQGLTLDLKSGLNQIRFGEATLRLEPDSVILH